LNNLPDAIISTFVQCASNKERQLGFKNAQVELVGPQFPKTVTRLLLPLPKLIDKDFGVDGKINSQVNRSDKLIVNKEE
jgi:hypothetical protein